MPSALITGASKGIGRAIALRLAPDYDIVALARSEDQLRTLGAEIAAKGGRCTAVGVDLRDPTAIATALQGVTADVLVNNAGVMHRKSFIDLMPDEWSEMMDVNVNAIYHVTHAILPGMIAKGAGHIINVSSIAGRSIMLGGSGYNATKHAVQALSECLMLEVRDHGVKVSLVMPGSVATELTPGGSKVAWALRPDDVAACVAQILSMPAHALTFMVEVRAARPTR
ncbi:MAG: SDR family NAD(P)-dependent oxidoreductase [Gemmatimonadaceae bacterium]|nr:SDR family NAD(P)-dependent oxidoreductase [Gemmatimonadaceae bacterium]